MHSCDGCREKIISREGHPDTAGTDACGKFQSISINKKKEDTGLMRVYPELIIEKSDDLTSVARNLRMIGAEIDRVRSALSGQEGLGRCQDALREMERETEDLVADLIMLSAALDDIGTIYIQCEQNAERDVEDGAAAPPVYGRAPSLTAVSEGLYF